MAQRGRTNRTTRKPARRKKRARSPLGRLARILYCMVVALSAVIVVTYAGVRIASRPPEIKDNNPPAANNTPSGDQEAEGSPAVSEDPGPQRKEYTYTFLLVASDQISGNTDTMMVLTYDTANQTAGLVSLPRDTMINGVKESDGSHFYKLNSTYAYNGIEGLKEEVSQILGFPIDFYVKVNTRGFVKLVDAIGGVDYNVPVNMNYYDPTQDLYINIPAGEQHLDGEEALKVVRFRSGYASADIGRIGTQQDFLKSVASQMLTLGNIPNLPTFIDIFEEYVVTNMSASNLAFFARQFLLCKSEDINFHTLPGNYGDSIKGLSYVSINISEWLEMVNTYLNPYLEDITPDMQHVIYDTTVNNLPVETGGEGTTEETASGGTTE